MHIIHSAHLEPVQASRQPFGWLQVSRGATHFPLRPIFTSRFLIGSGSNCHLQLGGEIPLIHSLLLRDFAGWTIEAIAAEPPLRVNDVPCRRCRLHQEDLISIGPFDLRLRLPVPTAGGRPSRQSVRLAG